MQLPGWILLAGWFIAFAALPAAAQDPGFTREDRERLIRLEAVLTTFMQQVEKRFEQIDKRLEQVDKRFEDLRHDMNNRFQEVNNRFEEVNKRFEQIDKRFEQVDKRMDELSKRMDTMVQLMLGIIGAFAAVVAVTSLRPMGPTDHDPALRNAGETLGRGCGKASKAPASPPETR